MAFSGIGVKSLFLILGFLELGAASRIYRAGGKLSSTSDSEGGSICSITEVDGHVQYGVAFKFKPPKKCNHATCNPHVFLSQDVHNLMHSEPNFKGEDGMCGCHVKEGPLKDSPVSKFLFKFMQFKSKRSGGYIIDCTDAMCWERYGQIITLGKRAERGTKTIDWPRTEDFESRNHYEAQCIEGSTGSMASAATVLPTIHQVLKKLKKDGKDEGVAKILQLVEDEPDEVDAPPIEAPAKEEKQMILVTEVDDVEDSAHHHNLQFVGVPTDLRNVVVLSPKHGTCSTNAVDYTSLSHDSVDCQLIKSAKDCGLAADLLKRSTKDGAGASDVFNDMSPPEDEAVQYFANDFKVKALKRYPPACFGRITGIGGQMHTSWNPLGVDKGNNEKKAKENRGPVANRLICGCYDKA